MCRDHPSSSAGGHPHNRLCNCFTEHCRQWGTRISLLSTCSLVLRPLPDFSLQPWRKIGRRPGIKTMSLCFVLWFFISYFYRAWLHFRRARVCVRSVQLFAKYRQGSGTLNPFHQYQKIKEAASLRSSTCKSFLPQKFSSVQVSSIFTHRTFTHLLIPIY